MSVIATVCAISVGINVLIYAGIGWLIAFLVRLGFSTKDRTPRPST
jgi:hypothetical protein